MIIPLKVTSALVIRMEAGSQQQGVAALPTFSFLTLTQGSLEKLSVSAIWMSAFSSSFVRSFLTLEKGRAEETHG